MKIWKKANFIVNSIHDYGVLSDLSVSSDLNNFNLAFATILMRFFASKLQKNV